MANENAPVPQPQSNSKVVQHGAEQSWFGVAGVSRPPATTPQEALQNDPRKNPVDPKLGCG